MKAIVLSASYVPLDRDDRQPAYTPPAEPARVIDPHPERRRPKRRRS